jgi:hypothetical protein
MVRALDVVLGAGGGNKPWSSKRWILRPIAEQPFDAVRGSGRDVGDRIKQKSDGSSGALHGVGRRRRKRSAQGVNIIANEHDVRSTAALTATKSQWIHAHHLRYVSGFGTRRVDGLQ